MDFSKTKVAEILGISRKTLYNKTVGQSGVTPKYTDTDDTQLDSAISTIKENHPNDGEVMITGHLLHKGIRSIDLERCHFELPGNIFTYIHTYIHT